MNHIFISYVRENSIEVQNLRDELIKHGLNIWIDRNDINLGIRWKDAIRNAIYGGAYFIACFSTEYYRRERSYMNEEITLAIEELRQRPTDRSWFIPVKLSDCQIPDRSIGSGETLRDIQWVELFKDWSIGIQKIINIAQSNIIYEKPLKNVLIVDDEKRICEALERRFIYTDSPYSFRVDTVQSFSECIKKIRQNRYDIIVLDVRLEDDRTGLEASLSISEQLGKETPIKIIFTGYPTYRDCVSALRNGAWDYIVKRDVDNKSALRIVVESATIRLQQIDLRRMLKKEIGLEWLPLNMRELQTLYGGQYLALWGKSEVNAFHVEVIASGQDAFELQDNLKNWRKNHDLWEQPFIVAIPVFVT